MHSIYELIRQEGAQTFLWKEAGDATIQAVRLLNTLGVPDSVIAKIVTTPPKEMSYLTIKELWEMGVEVAGHPKPPKEDDDIDWGKAETAASGGLTSIGKRFDLSVPGGCQIPHYVKRRLNHPGRNGRSRS